MHGDAPPRVAAPHLDARLDEEGDAGDAAGECGEVECAVAADARARLDVGAAGEEDAEDLCVSEGCGVEEGRPEAGVAGVDARAAGEEEARVGGLARRAGEVQEGAGGGRGRCCQDGEV